LVSRATDFEDKYIVGILGNDPHDREIKTWADGVSGHYERKRRMEILENARLVIVGAEDGGSFMAEMEQDAAGNAETGVIFVQGKGLVQEDSDAWGLDEDGSKEETEEDGWGFDDGDEPEPEVKPEPAAAQEGDLADAWAWNDDEASPVDDDPWAEELDEPTRPPAAPSIPKPTTHLQKTSVPHTNGTSPTKRTDTRPPQIALRSPPKETYLVSDRTKNIIGLVKDAIHEGQEFASSQLFTSSVSSSAPGALILQSALSILDLYRALYPVVFGAHLTLSSELALRFSNDCLYLSRETSKLQNTTLDHNPPNPDLENVKNNLTILGDSWFEDTIVSVWLL
jgi:centromere/kinetochore protein ZW10